jgi:hypothetical protein
MSVEQNLPISHLFCDTWHVYSNRISISFCHKLPVLRNPNLETWSEHIPHCLPSPSGERWWVAIQNCNYIVSFAIPMRTQYKIPYQHSHLIMSTLSPSTPLPPKRLFPEGFVICPKRISYLFSDLLHFITRINYSSYHPVTYPYNTKYKRENLIIMTSDCITSRLMGVML